jgi:hypothetical protein
VATVCFPRTLSADGTGQWDLTITDGARTTTLPVGSLPGGPIALNLRYASSLRHGRGTLPAHHIDGRRDKITRVNTTGS